MINSALYLHKVICSQWQNEMLGSLIVHSIHTPWTRPHSRPILLPPLHVERWEQDVLWMCWVSGDRVRRRDSGNGEREVRDERGECCGVRAFLWMGLCHPCASQIHHLLIPGHRCSVWDNKYQSSALCSLFSPYSNPSSHPSMPLSKITESKPPELREGVKRKAVAKGKIDQGSAGSGRGCIDDDDACFGAAFSVDNMVLTLSPF